MKSKIYCAHKDGKHIFYVLSGTKEYYLFMQEYRRGVGEYFSRGRTYSDAIDFSKAKGNFAVINTMKKIPSHIRYTEKLYGLVLTNKERRKFDFKKDKRAYA